MRGTFLVLTAWLSLFAFQAEAAPPTRDPGPMEIWVVASDAPEQARRQRPGVYLCDGTADNVEIQAATDAAGDGGGGIVWLSEGTFDATKPTSAVDISLTGCGIDTGTPSSSELTVFGQTYATGTHANVAIGQVFRLTAGDDGEGNTIEVNEESLVATVTAKSAANTVVTTATWTDLTNTLTEVGAFTNYVYAAGDKIYISGGTNATVGWYTIASRVSDDAITTTTDIDDGAGDLAAGDITGPVAVAMFGTMLEDYTGVVATRLIGAIQLKAKVSLIGAGLYATTIKLADQQNCDLIHTEYTTQTLPGRIQDLSLDGNKSNQGDEVATNEDGECNGIVLNEYTIDVQFRDMSVMSCKGDGWWILSPWGVRVSGGWTEANVGTGMVFMNRSVTSMWGHKIQGNSTAVRLRKAIGTLISGCHIEVDNLNGLATNNAIQLLNYAHENTFTGNWIGSKTASAGADAHCVYIKYGQGNTFTGNYFYVDGTKNVFTGGAAATDNAGGNIITGNVFYAGVSTVTYNNLRDSYQGSVFTGNYPSRPIDESTFIWVNNTSGGTLSSGTVVVMKAAADDEMQHTTTAGDAKVLGVVQVSTSNGYWGMVRTRGFTKYLKVNGTTDIAVGDLLCTHTDAGISQKAAAGTVAFAKALEAYTGDDSNGVIDALIIPPRQVQ